MLVNKVRHRGDLEWRRIEQIIRDPWQRRNLVQNLLLKHLVTAYYKI